MNPYGSVISHIFFADDTLIFLRATRHNCCKLVSLLNQYCTTSGQGVNLQKSCMFFGANTPATVVSKLGQVLNMPTVSDPSTYLGVLALWGRSKRQGLTYVKGRILQKLLGWRQHTISPAGKEVLIKVMAQAIPTYPMALFKFPVAVCNDLDSLISSFWWGQGAIERKIHWVSKILWASRSRKGVWGFGTLVILMMPYLLNSVDG